MHKLRRLGETHVADSQSIYSDEIEKIPLLPNKSATEEGTPPDANSSSNQNLSDDERDGPKRTESIDGNDISVELKFLQKVAIGCGHFQNDICSALWFTYLLLYLEKVVVFNTDEGTNSFPGILMLIGQIADGISTPLVGYKIDRSAIWPANYGRCKSWHLWGTLMTTFSLPFVFSPVIGGSPETTAWVKLVYYIPFVVIFQIGWATVQISHLAIVPKMHPDDIVRTELFSIRFGFTGAATICIYLMTYIRLHTQEVQNPHKTCVVDQSDAGTFTIIALLAVTVGLIFTAVFHLQVCEGTDAEIRAKTALFNTTRENQLNRSKQIVQEISSLSQNASVPRFSIYNTKVLGVRQKEMQIRDWLTLPSVYIVALIYMSSRLGMNLGQVFVPFFVQDSLQIECTNLALIPMTTCVTGCVFSFKIIETLTKRAGRQVTYAIGAAFGCTVAILILTLRWDDPQAQVLKPFVYGVAILLGANVSTTMVTSQALPADVIGNNIESSALVYGTLCFADKVTTGVAVFLLNTFVPCAPDELTCENISNAEYYTDVLGYSIGGTSLLGVLGMILLTFYILRQNSAKRSGQSRR